MNPLLENFFKRQGIVIYVASETDNSFIFNSAGIDVGIEYYDAWLESLVENVDYKIDGQKILLNSRSQKIQKIRKIDVGETLRNLDASILSNIQEVTINAPILENLTVGNIAESFTFNAGSPISIVFTGILYKNVTINGGSIALIEAKNEDAFKDADNVVFRPTTTTTENNKKKAFLRKTLKAKAINIKQEIIDDLDDDDLKSQINAKISGGSYSYSYSYSNYNSNNDDLIGNLPETTYKYFTNAVDTSWNNLLNWFDDADHLITSQTVGRTDENIYIGQGVTASFNNDISLGAESLNYGLISAPNVNFLNTAINHGNIQGNAKFYNQSKNRGHCGSNASFYGVSENLGSFGSGTHEFYDFSYNSKMDSESVYNAKFYDNSYNLGTVGFSFFYDRASHRETAWTYQTELSGYCAIETSSEQNLAGGNSSGNKSGYSVYGCSCLGFVLSQATFRVESGLMGTVNGNAYFYDNSFFFRPTVNANLYLYDNAGPIGTSDYTWDYHMSFTNIQSRIIMTPNFTPIQQSLFDNWFFVSPYYNFQNYYYDYYELDLIGDLPL